MAQHSLIQYQVDAFTTRAFAGNPAAVCPLDHWLDDSLLQAIAEENNLSETAFFVPSARGFELRWFTPLKEIDRLVRLGRPSKPMFRHGGNPVARWMADNLRPTVDSNGNVNPDKAKSTNKIDGISAATTAMFVAMNVEAETTSAYEDHGVESI